MKNLTKFIHFVGRRNNGKTTVIQQLIPVLSARGLKVGSIKHSAHQHELEAEKKDSYKHRKAGANPAGVITKDTCAIFLPRTADQDPYTRISPLFEDCELVLVEGDIERDAFKVEVWRESVGTPALVMERDDIQAVITDDPIQTQVPVLPRKDLTQLADRLLESISKG